MADDLNQTWDDLYEVDPPQTVPDPTKDPELEPDTIPEPELKPLGGVIDDDIKPTADSPEGLEAAAQAKASDLNDDDGDPLKDPAEDNNTDVPPGKKGEDDNDIKMTGIEQYLSQFDIEGGMITFDDGTSSHFDELAEEKKMEVLTQLHTSQTKTVEDKFGLDENEIGLINYLRTNKVTVEQMIEGMAEDRIKTLQAVREIETQDFKEMSPEAIYLQFLKKSNPEASTEDLEGDLEKAKQQSGFEKMAESLRKQLESDQSKVINSKLREDRTAQDGMIEEQRKQVVEAVAGMTDIAGVELNDNMKNGLLDRVLEVNDYGDSKFMEEVFGEPTKLFNAAFWYYYGTDLLTQRDTYWKQEKSKAYKRGRQEALGKDTTKISFTDKGGVKPVPGGAKAQPGSIEEDDWLSLHQ